MIRLDRLLWRLLVASCGFLVAVVASVAAIVASTGFLPGVEGLAGDVDLPLLAGLLGRSLRGFAMTVVFVHVVWPGWLLFACLAEIAALRRLFVHLAGFAAIAAGAVGATAVPPSPAALSLAAAAGFVGGFAHWLVAGRDAGIALPPTPRDGPPGGAR